MFLKILEYSYACKLLAANFFVRFLGQVCFLMFRVCLCRIQLTNTSRSSWLILPTMLSAMTHGSTGSAILCTSTGNSVDSPLLERNTGVFVARDTCTTRLDLQEGQTGRETTHSLFAATVNSPWIIFAVFVSSTYLHFFCKGENFETIIYLYV